MITQNRLFPAFQKIHEKKFSWKHIVNLYNITRDKSQVVSRSLENFLGSVHEPRYVIRGELCSHRHFH